MASTRIDTLERVPMATLAASWNRAFEDYAHPMSVSEEALGRFLRQNGVKLEASIGAFAGEELVGIWLNGVREVGGELTAYDSGTAIWKAFRGQGLSKLMSEKSQQVLKGIGVAAYVLEVLKENEKAFHVYRQAGFEVVRHFVCFETTAPTFEGAPEAGGYELEETTVEGLMAIELPPAERPPSWQNRIESTYEIRDRVRAVAARRDGRVAGFGMIQTDRVRIPQIGVTPEAWEAGLPSAVLRWLCEQIEPGREIGMLNVDEEATKTIGLLTRHGFTPSARQYEMRKRF